MNNPFLNFETIEQLSDQLSYRVLADHPMHYWWVETNDYTAAITLCGGQLVWFAHKEDKAPIIWLSDNSHLNDEKTLRGGVPICWPWFGRHPTDSKANPNHGLVRNIPWQLVQFEFDGTAFKIELEPTENQAVNDYVPQGVTVKQQITFDRQLNIKLITDNQSEDIFNFSAALHTYFNVGDIATTEVNGLIRSHYISEKTKWQPVDSPKCYRFREETDRIHIDRAEHAYIESPLQTYELTQSGHNSLIVWNPWKALAQNTPGLEGDVWQEFLCVEPAAFKPDLKLKPKQQHVLEQNIRVEE